MLWISGNDVLIIIIVDNALSNKDNTAAILYVCYRLPLVKQKQDLVPFV